MNDQKNNCNGAVSKIIFRSNNISSAQNDNDRNDNGDVCHALPCTIHSTSKYANVAGYFRPAPYEDDNNNNNNKSESRDNTYHCAQFRGRSLMAVTQPSTSSTSSTPPTDKKDIGIPLPPHIAGVVMTKSDMNNDLQVEASFRNIAEWQLAWDVGQMENLERSHTSRIEKVQHWTDLAAAVS